MAKRKLFVRAAQLNLFLSLLLVGFGLSQAVFVPESLHLLILAGALLALSLYLEKRIS